MYSHVQIAADATLALVYLLLTIALLMGVAVPDRIASLLDKLSPTRRRFVFLFLSLATAWVTVWLAFNAFARGWMGLIRDQLAS